MIEAANELLPIAAGEKMGIEIDVGAHGKDCRVRIDGVDISRYVQRVVILADVHNVTRIRLSCIQRMGDRIEHFTIRGQMVTR